MADSTSRKPGFTKPKSKIRLSFALSPANKKGGANGIEVADHNPTAIIQDISTAAMDGSYLWLGSDEFTSIERLTRLEDGSFGELCRYDLAKIFDLPEGSGEEIDIEGLDVADDCLWVVGSHSLKRGNPDPKEDSPNNIVKKLAKVKTDPNRYFLARMPLASSRSKTGPKPVASLKRKFAGKDTKVKAAALDLKSKTAPLIKLLARDEHLGKFMDIPSKENGFDIEGMAVVGQRVWLGLRGPVLRGWAVIIELRLKATKSGKLKPAKIGDKRYLKHFLDLDGLGIRSLTRDGNDLLVLAGPTMDLDGPSKIRRWSNALTTEGPQVLTSQELPVVIDLPYGKDVDHAEGTALLRDDQGRHDLLVVYDAPAPSRVKAKGESVDADLFTLNG